MNAISNSWLIGKGPDTYHVLPVADLRAHTVNEPCWCGAWLNADGNCIHNSLDQRELFDNGVRKPS